MALWNGADLNKTAAASMFDQMWGDGAVSIARKANGLLYTITGGDWEPRPPTEGIAFKGYKKISGDQIQWRLRGKNEALYTVADGSAELAAAQPVYSDDTFGAARAPLTHYANQYGVPDSEYDRIQGDEAKTKSYIADKFQQVVEDHEHEWGNRINGTQVGFTRTVMGSWVHAVSDGVSTGETNYAAYAQINRADPANADFRGLVSIVPTLTLGKILAQRNLVRVNGGRVRLLLAGTTIYSQLEELISNKNVVVEYDEKWSRFGGEYWMYAGMTGVMEHRMPGQTLGGLDPSTFAFWMDRKKIVDRDRMMVLRPDLAAGRVILPRCWTQLLCNKPNSNFKITGITGVA